ncbi:acyl-CoA dehydrogenase family protein [Streptomyces sp. NPDC002143]
MARGYARQADTEHVLPPDTKKILDSSPVPLGREELPEDTLPDFPDGPGTRAAIWYENVAYSDMWLSESLNRGVGHFVVKAIGTPEQVERWWDPVIANGGKTGFGMSEPGTGSDTSRIATTATRDGNTWVINGSKMFCSLGAAADYIVVFARISKDGGRSAIKSFIVERGHPGFTVVKANENKLGLRCWMTSQLAFDDCVVPMENMLGWSDGDADLATVGGLNAGLAGLNDNRPNVSSQSIGVAHAALDLTTSLLAEQRKSFAPHRWSVIQDELAQMAWTLDRARQLNLRAQWMKDQAMNNRAEASIAKGFGPPNADRVIRRCMQLLGPEGSSTDLLLEKWYRDIKILDIFEGTGQVMRMLISRSLMGRDAASS